MASALERYSKVEELLKLSVRYLTSGIRLGGIRLGSMRFGGIRLGGMRSGGI